MWNFNKSASNPLGPIGSLKICRLYFIKNNFLMFELSLNLSSEMNSPTNFKGILYKISFNSDNSYIIAPNALFYFLQIFLLRIYFSSEEFKSYFLYTSVIHFFVKQLPHKKLQWNIVDNVVPHTSWKFHANIWSR